MAVISSVPPQHAASIKPARVRWWRVRLCMFLGLLAGDLLAANFVVVQIYRWRLASDANLQVAFADTGADSWPIFLILWNVIVFVAFAAANLYTLKRGVSRIDEAFRVVVTITLAWFLALLLNALLLPVAGTSMRVDQTVLVSIWLGLVVAVTFVRAIVRTAIAFLRSRGYDTRRVVIVGARAPGREINARISRAPELGYRVQAFLSDSNPVGTLVDGVPVLGRTGSLGRVVRAVKADEVIIALSGRTPDEVLDLVSLAEDEATEIQVYPDVFHLITNNGVSIGDVSGLPLISVRNVALDSTFNRSLKRMLDLVVAWTALILLSPLMLLLALAIRLDSRGPIFFIQQRVGLDNRPFPTIKFRTMRIDAEQYGDWTTSADPRITRLGRFLRRYSLDELPQFINVVRGEMSVVGPRPEQPQYVERFSQSIPRYMRRHKQKAGITGWAQANGLRGDTSIEERTRYDLYYVENWSLLFDLKIIIKTAFDILAGRNRGS